MDIGKLLLLIGGIIFVIGVIYTLFPNISFPPRLPGDIFIKKDNFTFYFPIVTSIILSIILTLIINFFFRR